MTGGTAAESSTMRPLSARNPRVQRLARLAKRREERIEQRALLVEGPVLLGTALDGGATVVDVFVDESAVHDPAVADVVGRLPDDVVPWVLPRGVLDRVGDATVSQGVTAVVEKRDPPWPTPSSTRFVLVLVDVADPGNVGTLVRAAAAAGAGAVVVAGGADPSSPKVVRSSAGAVFGVDVISGAAPGEVGGRLRSLGYRTIGTSVRHGMPYHEADLTGAVALVLGNEAHGLGFDVVGHLDDLVTIPMAGPTESLNVAMAGTLLAFEVRRQGGQPDR